jgi:hypothetical protein
VNATSRAKVAGNYSRRAGIPATSWRIYSNEKERRITASCLILFLRPAAVGLWTHRRWGYRVGIAVLSVNLLGDLLNAVVRGDWRTLIGLPIGGAMLAYLLSRRIRNWFALRQAA